MDFKSEMAEIMQGGFRTSEELAAEPRKSRWWCTEVQCWIYEPEGSLEAAVDIEHARCIAAVHKALADWPQVPSEATKRFAAMVIANIEGKA